MKNSKLLTNAIILFIFIVFLTTSAFVNKQFSKPIVFITKQQSSINLSENFWNLFNIGQRRLFSSLVWIATILESDQAHYKGNDLNSWMYLRFKSMSLLEPRFLETYAFGGIYLSIIKDDLDGASEIFKLGLKQYPNNTALLKGAFHHFYYEVQDFEMSEFIINQLKVNKAIDSYMVSALGRIQSMQGNLQDAYIFVLENYNEVKDQKSFVSEKLYSYLYAIKAEMDLECLNAKKERCALNDLNGRSYILNSQGIYQAQSQWIPFRPQIKKGR